MITPEIQTFIDAEFAALKAYNAQRPQGHPYAFHLHSQRVAKHLRQLALDMGMDADYAQVLYSVGLVHDIGKRLLPIEIWDVAGKPDEKTRKHRRQHTVLGVQIVDEHFGADNTAPVLMLMRDLMTNHHEAIDGSGWLKKQGDELSLEAKMLCVCDAYDGYSVWRPHYGARDITPSGVIRRMAVEKAGQFDPIILGIFAKRLNVDIE